MSPLIQRHSRRDFLRGLGLTAAFAGIASTGLFPHAARAGEPAYDGPLVITLQASGAWDPRFLCDPVDDRTQNRIASGVASVGGLNWASIPLQPGSMDLTAADAAVLVDNDTFFGRWGKQTTALLGVRSRSVAHTQGRRQTFVGMGRAGVVMPCLPALLAANKAPDLPLAFLSTGGVETSAPGVALTRISGADGLGSIMEPWRTGSRQWQSAEVHDLVREYREATMDREVHDAPLGLDEQGWRQLNRARLAQAGLGEFSVTNNMSDVPKPIGKSAASARVMLAAMAQGYAAGGNLTVGGFDTHADHDARAPVRNAHILTLADFILREAQQLGIANRLTIVMGSDFGRTPGYNARNGKGHHGVSQSIVIHPFETGGRTVGARLDKNTAAPLDPKTLLPSESGITVDDAMVQQALRRLLGIADTPLSEAHAQQIPMELDLFG